ncbi:MAG: hypothetical protein ONB44_07820 [candidate division KSB1 bacterium]|nr:hypothetical protein [candidate division KSB1 bacterium]MDZ7302034.1 hypothetical protein [candidate division KSB1 bacterium]MDZ7311077.1 hypothetical protein [candidate division KSB1 bacterium]
MRSIVATVLLLFMLLQAAGYLFVFEIQKYEIRREIKQHIKAGVPEAELVLFKICEGKPHPAFQRVEEHEFRYDGQMYDVVRQESHGDTTWYYCLADEKETQLFANLEELVKRDLGQNAEWQQRVHRLLNLFVLLFFSPNDGVCLVDVAEEMAWDHHGFGLKTWIDPPPTPPPEA